MSIFISVVSHHNSWEIINGLKPHALKTPDSSVILLDNLPTQDLAGYAESNGLVYLENSAPKGFGANHNKVFDHCLNHLGMAPEGDWFVILNPDLECSPEAIDDLLTQLENADATIGAPNIFKDSTYAEQEESVRRFPYLWELITSYFFRKNRTGINRNTTVPCEIDWASGACLAFRTGTFRALKGFDERYFLYYEDVDICWRARHALGQNTWYVPSARMVHRGKRASHRLNNRHLFWHLSSALRFSWVRLKTAAFGANSLT